VRKTPKPVGRIRVHDERGYAYIPKLVRQEVGLEGRGNIPYFIDAKVVLLVKGDATAKEIIESLEALKREIELRARA